MTILHCELGNHDWERTGRGRPPKNCPEHQPAKNEIKLSISSKGLKAEAKPSINLEKIIPGISEFLAQGKTETLICEVGGHEWTRESKRGKKPSRCPEHSEIISKSLPAQSTARTQDLIAEILSSPRAANCHCGMTPEMSPADIRALEGGCTDPQYICGTLDEIRRKLNL